MRCATRVGATAWPNLMVECDYIRRISANAKIRRRVVAHHKWRFNENCYPDSHKKNHNAIHYETWEL